MILAQNQLQAVLLLVLSAFCWALWAGMHRLTRKWRYEMFYVDLAIGVGIAVLVYAFTVGSLGFDGFSFTDDVMHAGKRQLLFALAAGVIFNLANMILMGAVTVAGLSVAVPVGVGLSTFFGLGLSLLLHRSGHPLLVFSGSAAFLVAVILTVVAYTLLISARQDKLVQEGKVKVAANVPGYSKGMIVSTDAPSSIKGLLLCGVAAALMWIMYPLIDKARAGDIGLGPYSVMVLFGIGIVVSTFVFNLFFMNLPVEGEPVEPFDYLRGTLRDHAIGLVAGVILATGLLAELVVAAGPAEAQLRPAMFYGLKQLAPLIAAVAGVAVWKEFEDAGPRVKVLLFGMIALFAVAAACLAAGASLGR